MPGDSFADALSTYTSPIQRAVSCLGTAKLTLTHKRLALDLPNSWSLNRGAGMKLRLADDRPAIFEAERRFRLIAVPESDPRRETGRFRVRTLGYAYNLKAENGTLSWHWHPKGNSPEQRPHMHLPGDSHGHYPTPRFSIEEVIRWVITRGAAPACGDWEARLMESDGVHKLHRSWVDQQPPE